MAEAAAAMLSHQRVASLVFLLLAAALFPVLLNKVCHHHYDCHYPQPWPGVVGWLDVCLFVCNISFEHQLVSEGKFL